MPTDQTTVAAGTERIVELGGILHTGVFKNFGATPLTLRFNKAERGITLDVGDVLSVEAFDTSETNPSKIVTEYLWLESSGGATLHMVWTTKG
jgi:hypothetical protein